jgi:putative ABC transport system substrate-binding protein
MQELVGLQPNIILTGGTPTTIALQRETRTIPIVFATVSDPVASGIVARLDRPSGNVTGFANLEASLPPELTRQAFECVMLSILDGIA